MKGVVLKCGGGELYRKARYFFAGMILGAFVVSGTWLAIDAVNVVADMTENFVLNRTARLRRTSYRSATPVPH